MLVTQVHYTTVNVYAWACHFVLSLRYVVKSLELTSVVIVTYFLWTCISEQPRATVPFTLFRHCSTWLPANVYPLLGIRWAVLLIVYVHCRIHTLRSCNSVIIYHVLRSYASYVCDHFYTCWSDFILTTSYIESFVTFPLGIFLAIFLRRSE